MNNMLTDVHQIFSNKYYQKYKNIPKEGFISPSAFIRALKEPFDAEKMSAEMVRKYYDNPDSKYYHMTQEDIMKMWENLRTTAQHKGCAFDDYIELLYRAKDTGDMEKVKEYISSHPELTNQITQITKFFNKVSLEKFNTREEWVVLELDGCYIRGRFDALFEITPGHFLLVDWKTTKDIKTSSPYHKKMLGPLCTYDECEFNEYSIQLSIYKYALERTYGLTEVSPIIVNVLPEGDECQILRPKIIDYNTLVDCKNYIRDNSKK